MRKIYSVVLLLLASLTAFCQDPGWTVNPGSFAYSMTATTVANVSCVELVNDNNKIGAFVGGQCRGVINTGTTANGRKLGFLVIYSNVSSGEKVKFKIYDSVLDSVFDSADSLVFSNNATVGSISIPYVVSTNHAPTDIQLSGIQVYENMPLSTFVSTLTTTDTDVFDTHTYSLVSGILNNDEFLISASSILTDSMFNYETVNQKTISLTTDDGNGCIYTEQFTITILDTNDVPADIQLSNTSIPEELPSGTFTGKLTTSDEDGWDNHSYTLVTGTGSTHNIYFKISGDSLKTDSVLNYENISSYSIRVRTTDLAGTFFEKIFTITLIDTNDPPTDILISNDSLTENLSSGSFVGNFSVIDEDAVDNHSYTLTANAVDNNNFQVNGMQLLSTVTFDFENKNSYTIEVKVTDSGNDTLIKQFMIVIKDTNDVPTDISLSQSIIQENQPAGTFIGNFSTTDQDTWDVHAYTLVTGAGDTDNSNFTISGTQLLSADTFHYAVQDTFSIRVRTTDSAGTFYEEVFIITVTDENDAPTDIFLSNDSIAENEPTGTFIGLLGTADVDTWDDHAYTLVTGTGDIHNTYFSISGDSLITDSVLDYENINTYSVRLRTTDLFNATFEKVFSIYAIDKNDPPIDLLLDNTTITENLDSASFVGNLSVVDVDAVDSHSFALTGNTSVDNSQFQISGIQLISAVSFDFEIKNSFVIEVKVTDSGNDTLIRQFTISIKDTNDIPTDMMISDSVISENMPAGTLVGNISTVDQDTWDTHTYNLVSGVGDDDNTGFAISGTQLLSVDTFDYEVKDTLSVRVRTTDSAGTYFEKIFIITVKDENDAPTDISLGNDSVAENEPVGTFISIISTADVDTWDDHTYTLVTGAGDTHNSYFSISEDSLFTDSVLDFENISAYSVRLRTTDLAGTYYEKVFTINAIDMNDAPENILLDNDSITENLNTGSFVANLAVIDEDAVDSHTYVLTTDTLLDNALFQVSGNQLLSAASFDYETTNIYTIAIKVTDSGNDTTIKQFTIFISDTNDVPADVMISDTFVSENQSAGTFVCNFSTSDQDTWDNHVYSLVPGAGDTNNLSFTVSGSQLSTSAIFNYELKNQYSIRVRTTDIAGTFTEKRFLIFIKDENDGPTDIAISADTISENAPENATVAVLSTTDEDVADTMLYSLVAGTGSADNNYFSITDNLLLLDVPANYEQKNQYSVRLKTDDQHGGTFEKEFTILINDINESPSIIPETYYVSEDASAGTDIGIIEFTDEDGGQTHTFSILNQNDVPFNIVPSTGMIQVSDAILNYETTPSYTLKILLEDNGIPVLTDTLEITVIINDAIEDFLPTVNYISPNGDGKNDFWVIKNVELYHDFSLLIFNESGLTVYERNEGYDNSFDGMFDGKALPTGTYYFVLQNGNTGKNFKGIITIVN